MKNKKKKIGRVMEKKNKIPVNKMMDLPSIPITKKQSKVKIKNQDVNIIGENAQRDVRNVWSSSLVGCVMMRQNIKMNWTLKRIIKLIDIV